MIHKILQNIKYDVKNQVNNRFLGINAKKLLTIYSGW